MGFWSQEMTDLRSGECIIFLQVIEALEETVNAVLTGSVILHSQIGSQALP